MNEIVFDAKEDFQKIVNTDKKDEKGRTLYKYEPDMEKSKRLYKHSLAEQDIERRLRHFEEDTGLKGVRLERADFFNQFKVTLALLKLKGLITDEDYTDVEHLFLNMTLEKLENQIPKIKTQIAAAKLTQGIVGPDGKPLKIVKG